MLYEVEAEALCRPVRAFGRPLLSKISSYSVALTFSLVFLSQTETDKWTGDRKADRQRRLHPARTAESYWLHRLHLDWYWLFISHWLCTCGRVKLQKKEEGGKAVIRWPITSELWLWPLSIKAQIYQLDVKITHSDGAMILIFVKTETIQVKNGAGVVYSSFIPVSAFVRVPACYQQVYLYQIWVIQKWIKSI